MTKSQDFFSTRMGYQNNQIMQTDDISDNLSADIFNFIWSVYFEGIEHSVREKNFEAAFFDESQTQKDNFRKTWTFFFHKPLSDFSTGVFVNSLNQKYNNLEWFMKYDFVEFCFDTLSSNGTPVKLCKRFNKEILERNNSGFRFVKSKLIPITSKIDSRNINKAVDTNMTDNHIEKAIKELSKRKNRNTNQIAAEAINGVESATKSFVQQKSPSTNPSNKSLGQLIKVITKKNLLTTDNAYSESMNKLYGYLSNSGVRHGKLPNEKSTISIAEAIYILEICSAYINYLKSEMQD